jgi:hypothetical protein
MNDYRRLPLPWRSMPRSTKHDKALSVANVEIIQKYCTYAFVVVSRSARLLCFLGPAQVYVQRGWRRGTPAGTGTGVSKQAGQALG